MGIGIPLFLRRDAMARGQAIYRKRVRPAAHPGRKGEFVAMLRSPLPGVCRKKMISGEVRGLGALIEGPVLVEGL